MLANLMEAWEPSYSELEKYYSKYFSLGGLNTTIENKFGLISLICYITQQVRKKNPDATCYQVIMKIVGDSPINDYNMEFLRGLSVVCTDFMNHTTEFLTFDLKSSKEMITKIREILNTWLPF